MNSLSTTTLLFSTPKSFYFEFKIPSNSSKFSLFTIHSPLFFINSLPNISFNNFLLPNDY